jgi:hypothetical protein
MTTSTATIAREPGMDGIVLLLWLHASSYWGIGRWWRGVTPALLHEPNPHEEAP